VRPELDWVLIDPAAKRLRFCRQAVVELGLANVTVLAARAGTHRDPRGFATIVSRAVMAAPELWGQSRHLLVPGGRVLAMTGRAGPAREDLHRLDPEVVATLVPVQVPGLDAERHLLVLEREAPPGEGRPAYTRPLGAG
jgi:16S rRNA (guanine527-N7)-methyltransferase